MALAQNAGPNATQSAAQSAAQSATQTVATKAAAPVRFRPTATGAPSVRLTGGSRGAGDATLRLDVLAPDAIGITTQEQPSLFWYQSKPANAMFELSVLQDNKVDPIVHVRVERSTRAGIQRFKLSDHGGKLEVGIEYQWVVALVTDPDNRSSDLVASGMIKRVEPAAELKAMVAEAVPASLPAIYAEAGIWYDALAAMSDQVEAQPLDASLQGFRADLLRQVGLKAAADFIEVTRE